MKRSFYSLALAFIATICMLNGVDVYSQCTNADFSDGNFTGWTGTWGFGTFCITQPVPNPYQNTGLNQGANNAAPNSTPQKNQFIMTGGNDTYIGQWGYNMPVVYPGTSYSARIGNTHADGDGESITYSFLVTANNCNFTYHYATVIQQATDASHSTAGSQPYFNIKMVDGSNNPITCADFEVDGSTAPSIGGFTTIPTATTGIDPILFKPWTSVFIPLNAYIGQTVKITFTTRSCYPCILGICCGGDHFSYAYISAECSPLQIVSSSPTVCGGSSVTLTGPPGAATYSWTGPGVTAPTDSPKVVITQPGTYTLTMTTFGSTPCTFSIDTTIPAAPTNPSAKFSATTVCAGSPTAFTDLSTPAGSITAWAWNFGTGTATTPNPTFTFPAAGTYPVSLTVTAGGCTADTTINAVVSPVPTSTFIALPTPLCTGAAATITYTGNAPAGATYNWNFAGGTVISGSGQGPYQVSWSTPGPQNITLSVTQGSCTSPTTTVTVTVNATPTLTVSPDVAVCTGAGTTLTASGGTTYAWSPAAGLSTTTGASVTATPAATTTYTVTATTSGCTATGSVTVSVNPTPTSTFTVSPATLCTGASTTITYTGNAPAGATYTWGFAGGTITSGSGQGPYVVSWPAAGAQNVTLTVAEGSCSSTPTTIPVTVNATPAVTVSPDVAICTGTNTTLTAAGATTYAWSPAAGLSTTTGASVTAAPAATTTYTVTGTTSGCSATASVTVAVSPIPTSAFTATPTTVCAGTDVTITYTGNAPAAATYTWNFNGGAIVSGSGQGPYVVSWATGGSYTVSLTVSVTGCTSPQSTQTVTVNPSPAVTVSPDVTICAGTGATLTAAGATTYTWSPATGLSGTTGATVNAQPASTTTYTVTGTTAGCTGTASVTVSVNPVPTATFTATPSVCAGANDTIVYTGGAPAGATYTWNFDGGNTISGNGQGPYIVDWTTANTYTIDLTVTQNGCTSAPASVPVTVNASPVSDAGPTVNICSGATATLGTTTTAGYTYAWSPPTGLNDPTISDPVLTGTNTTTAAITTNYVVTTTANGCSSTAIVAVTITPTPVADFTVPAGQCLNGNSFSFQAGGTFMPGAAFAWSFGADATPGTSTSQNPTVTYQASGINTVTLQITQNGCPGNTFTASDTVYPTPVGSLTADSVAGCENLYVCFTSTTSSSGCTYLWSFGDGGTSALQNPCHTYTAPGVYTVMLDATSSEGCTVDTTIPNMITVAATPVAAFTPDNATLQIPESQIVFTNQSRNATTYLWNFGNSTTSTQASPTASYNTAGHYYVTLTAYNQFGCLDTVGHPVIVLGIDSLYIPNAFTPNGDGVNDFFEVFGNKDSWVQLEVEIFDRWGEKVFESRDMNFQWDGTYRGVKLEPSVFVYEIRIVFADIPTGKYYKGSLTLIR